MSDTSAIANGLRLLGDDELLVVAGGEMKEKEAVRVCVQDCVVIRYRNGGSEQRCEPPKCGPPPK